MSGPGALFAYGTLLDEALVAGLLGREVRAEPAQLLDFELLTLEGFSWPTAFHAPGETIPGRAYRGLTPADLERLDAYEGVGEDLYQRIEAEITMGEGPREPAFVYVPTERTLRRYGAL